MEHAHPRYHICHYDRHYALAKNDSHLSDFVYNHSPTVHDEVDIVGQDGHIYKGRMGRSRLPPLAHVSYAVDHISPRTKYYKSR